jgi:phenolic acid decarboxylase
MPPAFDPAAFDRDLRDVHLIYDYAAEDAQGQAQSWRYETWFFSDSRVVYAIHGGPMAGRVNFQTATYQCIRPGELWQVNWLEETGTVVSLVYDIPRGTVTTLIAFSKGHWDNPESAHGDKRVSEDFKRWRTLRKIGDQGERVMLSEQATVAEKFMGKGVLKPIEMSWPTM